jgi:hypothetical protein
MCRPAGNALRAAEAMGMSEQNRKHGKGRTTRTTSEEGDRLERNQRYHRKKRMQNKIRDIRLDYENILTKN